MLPVAWFLFILASQTFATTVDCNNPFEQGFNIVRIKEVFRSCPLLHKRHEFVKSIPEDIRGRSVLMYNSRSSQAVSIDPLYPRIIISNQKADVLLAMTGNPAKPKFDQLELIEFDAKTKKFVPYEIRFASSEHEGQAQVFDNPRSCYNCHGRSESGFHPIWESYSRWPGMYGSDGGLLTAKEYKLYVEFDQRAQSDENYGLFPRSPIEDDEFGADHKRVESFERNALALNIQLDHLNAERIASWLKTKTSYDLYQFALYGALLGCGDLPSFLPKSIQDQLPSLSTVTAQTQERFLANLNDRYDRFVSTLFFNPGEGEPTRQTPIPNLYHFSEFLVRENFVSFLNGKGEAPQKMELAFILGAMEVDFSEGHWGLTLEEGSTFVRGGGIVSSYDNYLAFLIPKKLGLLSSDLQSLIHEMGQKLILYANEENPTPRYWIQQEFTATREKTMKSCHELQTASLMQFGQSKK